MSKQINLNTYYYKKSDIDTFLANKANLVHVHGNITNDGKVGTTANKPLITGTNGVIQASNFGTTANTFCQGNDSRLSDARTPTSHTHGNITNAGIINGQSNKNVITDFNGLITTEDKPTIPTKTSDLTNDSGFLTTHQDISSKVDIDDFNNLENRVYNINDVCNTTYSRVEEIEEILDDKVDISDFNALQIQIINIINGIGEE